MMEETMEASGSAPEMSRVGRGLWRLGAFLLVIGFLGALLDAYGRIMSVLTAAAAHQGMMKDVRYVVGGGLCMLAAHGISSRQEWGRRFARNAALVGLVFGIRDVLFATKAEAPEPRTLIGVLGFFIGMSYICFWLERPAFKAHFTADQTDGLVRRFAPVILGAAVIVAIVTSQ